MTPNDEQQPQALTAADLERGFSPRPDASGWGAFPTEGDEASLVFRVGHLWLALLADRVVEVVQEIAATPIPRAPVHLVGLMSLRGRALPLVDLERFLRLTPDPEADVESFPRVVVVRWRGDRVGLRSPQVRGVLGLRSGDFRPSELARSERLTRFCPREHEGPSGLVHQLDLDALLDAAKAG